MGSTFRTFSSSTIRRAGGCSSAMGADGITTSGLSPRSKSFSLIHICIRDEGCRMMQVSGNPIDYWERSHKSEVKSRVPSSVFLDGWDVF